MMSPDERSDAVLFTKDQLSLLRELLLESEDQVRLILADHSGKLTRMEVYALLFQSMQAFAQTMHVAAVIRQVT